MPFDRSIDQGLLDGTACGLAAIDYARFGWSVTVCCPPDHVGVGKWHKCGSPGKAPLHKWKDKQTNRMNVEEIEGYTASIPTPMWG